MCYVPATRVKEHQKLRKQREDQLKRRKLRAEWAAAGLDVDEMERQEMMKRRRMDHRKISLDRVASRDSALVSSSPALRSISPRQDDAADEMEKTDVITAEQIVSQHQQAINAIPRFPSSYMGPKIPLEAVREVSQPEIKEYSLQGHGRRIASGASEHGDISYQIVAASPAKKAVLEQRLPPRPSKAHRSITTQGLMPPIGPTITTASSASLRPTHKGHTASLPSEPSISSHPTLVRPLARRLHESQNLSVSIPAKDATILKKDSPDLRSDSPRFFNRARASLDLATAASQLSRPCSPSYSPAGLLSSASSDACSITSKRSFFGGVGSVGGSNSLSRASTPPCISDLADRACKSRWEANASERKIWKDEVDRITLYRLTQASKRRKQDAQSVSRLHHQDSNDSEMMNKSMSNDSQMTNLALLAEKRLRRASVEPRSVKNNDSKLKRRSSQKA